MNIDQKKISSILSELIEFRHDLHRHPEIGFEEHRTSQRVADALRKLPGMKVSTGFATTGVVGLLGEDLPGPCIGLRADMDCLPIEEKTMLPYASTNPGYMHACGHDGHTTILLGTAMILAQYQDQLPGPVKFLFQPAEERLGGGKVMVEEGVMEQPSVTEVYGLHGWPSLKLGQMGLTRGPMMANSDEFTIRVIGQGGHAAFPHLTVDPIAVAAQVIQAAQNIVSRATDPLDSAVITFASIHGGKAKNVIPDEVVLHGTIRTLSEQSRQSIFKKLRLVVEKTCEAQGAKADVDLIVGYPVVINDDTAHDRSLKAIGQMSDELKAIQHPPVMGGEDFAYYGQKAPGNFAFLGICPKDRDSYPGLHQADFDFNDDAIPLGIRYFCELALNR